MKDFNIAKYLKENHLGPHGILGRYVDLQPLKEEDDYGNNEPTQEVPYVGADEKLDGFGDEFDQVDPVSEIEDAEENTWMYDVDGTEDYSYGDWKCAWIHPGILNWAYGDTSFSELEVRATPNYDGDGKTNVIVLVNEREAETIEIDRGVFQNWENYRDTMSDYLDGIEDKYADSKAPTSMEESMNEEEPEGDQYDGEYDAHTGPAITSEEEEDDDDYSEEQGQFDTMMNLSHEYLGDPSVRTSIFKIIKNLRDHGFSDQDIVDFLATEF